MVRTKKVGQDPIFDSNGIQGAISEPSTKRNRNADDCLLPEK